MQKVEKRIAATRRRAATRKLRRVVDGGKETKGYMDDPKAVAVAGGNKRLTPSQPPFKANEKARLVHCIARQELRPSVETMLRGVTERVAIDDKLDRIHPYKELVIISNDEEMVFENFFFDRAHTTMRSCRAWTRTTSPSARNCSRKVSTRIPHT